MHSPSQQPTQAIGGNREREKDNGQQRRAYSTKNSHVFSRTSLAYKHFLPVPYPTPCALFLSFVVSFHSPPWLSSSLSLSLSFALCLLPRLVAFLRGTSRFQLCFSCARIEGVLLLWQRSIIHVKVLTSSSVCIIFHLAGGGGGSGVVGENQNGP